MENRKLKWYQNNRELVNERRNAFNRTEEGKYRIYKIQAQKRNLDFKLSFEEFKKLIRGFCFYCGDLTGSGTQGVDRVDSNIGYINSNCVGACMVCNRMKSNSNIDDFLKQCKKVAGMNKLRVKGLLNGY